MRESRKIIFKYGSTLCWPFHHADDSVLLYPDLSVDLSSKHFLMIINGSSKKILLKEHPHCK